MERAAGYLELVITNPDSPEELLRRLSAQRVISINGMFDRVELLLSQQNMTGSADSLSLGERAGERVVSLRVGFVCKGPHPNPLPRGEGVKPADTGHIWSTY